MEKVFFDCRYIRVNHHDGISRFSAGLFAALSKLTDCVAIVSDLRQLDKLPSGTNFVKVADPTSVFEPLVALSLNRAGAKLVFSPMQTIGSFGRKFKLILTVHDLIYYRHPTPPPSFSLPIRILWRLYHLVYWPQRLLLNRSDAVVTVSETTRGLIAKHNLTKRPVKVVYNASANHPHPAGPSSRPKSKQSLVYMGSFMDYKNVEVLIRGMQWLPNYELNLLSKISEARRNELEQLVPKDATVNFVNGVSEEKYQQYLSTAVALVSGSLDEGFGIPLVEAMSLGIPTVISDIQIFREIGDEAAIYFDPKNPKAFADAVTSIESDSAWQVHSEKSKLQAKKFGWDKSAKSLLDLLTQI